MLINKEGNDSVIKEKLYPAIFKRKSVRRFQQEKLDEETLRELMENTTKLTSLDSNIKTEFKLMDSGSVKGLLSIKAPHYLLFFSEDKEGHLINAGFLMQQMDLLLSSLGIGACWLGLAKPTDKKLKSSGMPFVISLALGKPSEPAHRESRSEFKRKKLSEIFQGEKYASLMEAVRLAPSGTNSQPWYFVEKDNVIHAFCIKKGKIKALLYERMNQIDMGIALCHLWVAAIHDGMQIDFFRASLTEEEIPKNYTYTYSAKILEGGE